MVSANFPAELFQYSARDYGEFRRFHFANPVPPSSLLSRFHPYTLARSSCVPFVPCFAFLFELQQCQLLTFARSPSEPFLPFFSLSSLAPPFARKRSMEREETEVVFPNSAIRRREQSRPYSILPFLPIPPSFLSSVFRVSGSSEREKTMQCVGLIDIPFFLQSPSPPPSPFPHLFMSRAACSRWTTSLRPIHSMS